MKNNYSTFLLYFCLPFTWSTIISHSSKLISRAKFLSCVRKWWITSSQALSVQCAWTTQTELISYFNFCMEYAAFLRLHRRWSVVFRIWNLTQRTRLFVEKKNVRKKHSRWRTAFWNAHGHCVYLVKPVSIYATFRKADFHGHSVVLTAEMRVTYFEKTENWFYLVH